MQMTMQALPVLPSVGEQIPAAGKGLGRKPAADTFALLLGSRMEAAPADGALPEGGIPFAAQTAAPAEGTDRSLFGEAPKDLAAKAAETTEETALETALPLWPAPAGNSAPPDQSTLPTGGGTEAAAPEVPPAMQLPAADSEEAILARGEIPAPSAQTPQPQILPAVDPTAPPAAPPSSPGPLPVAAAEPPPSPSPLETAQILSASSPTPALPEAPAENRPAEKRTGLMDRQFAGLLDGVKEASPRAASFGEVSENRPLPTAQPSSQAPAVLAPPPASPEGGALETPLPPLAADEGIRAPSGHTGSHPLAAAEAPAPVQHRAAAEAPAVALPSGQSVPESRIVDQVVGRLAVAPGGEGGSVTLKLHPEELGEVTVDLVMEKDRVKAQIVAQSQQVQEVLERHLPKLRSALENQGLKLDTLQVSVDSQGDGGRGFFQEHQRPSAPVRFALHGEPAPGREPHPAAYAAPREGRGINLRV